MGASLQQGMEDSVGRWAWGWEWAGTRLVAQGSSHFGPVETNPTRIHEDAGAIPALAQGVKDRVVL